MQQLERAPTEPRRDTKSQRLVIFANKFAGTLARSRGGSPLENYARAAGFEPEVIYTRSSTQLQRILREKVAEKIDRVVIAGGDGTIHAAVQVLANTDTAVGILAQGTANNFANSLRLARDLPTAFQTIARGNIRDIDLGEANGEYFTEGAGVGVFADALSVAGCGRTKSIPRTLRTLVQLLVTNRRYRLTLVIDGVPYTEEVLDVEVANTHCLGLNMPIAPTANLSDSQLDVVVFKALSRREWIPYFKAIYAQAHLDLPKVVHFRAKTVEIHSRRPITAHVDDRAWRRTPLTIRMVPRGLKVFVDEL
ncbi:MAG: protein bmrU [Armatimonadetes bacterium]|jgi:diacylglycerol kinase (ATP)|nr:protein bmrU [Armatimonadota bacterium]